ncbi:efflux RND transporter periplasmic adaptor subunit [Myroides sp. NP-2]|uniref:efflux RND transporter periplasmic adaptor subunit n=1 Tax=Myroides sp. NP-2 TaxID=2759945 RepID=UPI0015F87BBD|nr:efflux RND transporter periplasmic adaptor subunit [Myroides sp. NP-2]MBB1150765.1 efflux RND transporter periplasmic adaptor subunit [Myroides sp. NP-2]
MSRVYRNLSVFAYVGGAVLLLLLAVGCKQNTNDAAQMGGHVEVKTERIALGDAEITRQYTAALQGKVNVEVRAQATGYIDKILVKEGSYVKKGQALFLIDRQPYQIKLQHAEATLKAASSALVDAQLELDKVKSLVDNKFVSPIQLQTANAALDSAKAMVAQAKAAVAEAQLNLSYCTVTAPVDGFLGRIPKLVGNLVTAGEPEPLTTMSDISQIYAYFSLTEADYFDLVKGNNGQADVLPMDLELQLSNGDIYPLKGKVDMINGEFDKATNALSVRAVFDNPDKLLRNGGTGIVSLIAKKEGVLQVPIAATLDLQDKVFAYVLGKDNQVEQRQLKIVGKNLHTYFVQSGIENGETIVTTGLDKIADGDVIAPIQATPNAQISAAEKEQKDKREESVL